MNQNSRATLSTIVEPSIDSPVALTLAWSSPMLTAAQFSSVVKAGATAPFLVIAPALLSRGTYSFVLTASQGLVSSSSTFAVTVNEAPRNGYVAVEPDSGVVLQTKFEIAALGWSDDATVRPMSNRIVTVEPHWHHWRVCTSAANRSACVFVCHTC